MENRIECLPDVMMGKPVIVGTRITVEFVLEALSAGETITQLLEEYPALEREDVLAALEFAAHSLRSEFVFPISQTA
ncbi:MAG: DUF433 domain-containing protein [Dehalococcoidia bacterium]